MSDKPKVGVVIAEDHELVRYGLVMALEEKADCLKILGEAENGQQAVEAVEKHKPDIVLMDIGMPVKDGITATQEIKQRFPEVKVIMLTSHQDEREVFASLASGADAYCMKDIKIERLCQVMEMVMEGALWLDPAIAGLMAKAAQLEKQELAHEDKLAEEAATNPKRVRYNAELTAREAEVLQLIVDGKSNKEIAQILSVTTHTAKAHVGNIIQKLAVDDRTQAAVKALQEGILG